MRIAPEGWPFILAFWALELVLYAFAPLWAALLSAAGGGVGHRLLP